MISVKIYILLSFHVAVHRSLSQPSLSLSQFCFCFMGLKFLSPGSGREREFAYVDGVCCGSMKLVLSLISWHTQMLTQSSYWGPWLSLETWMTSNIASFVCHIRWPVMSSRCPLYCISEGSMEASSFPFPSFQIFPSVVLFILLAGLFGASKLNHLPGCIQVPIPSSQETEHSSLYQTCCLENQRWYWGSPSPA